MENYDMSALYLYKPSSYGSYYIDKIQKINTKTINMGRANIKKEDFSKLVHKLTQEETVYYNEEVIKIISGVARETYSLMSKLNKLKEVLYLSEFASINTQKLQEEIDKLTDIISECNQKLIEIDGKKFKLSAFNCYLEEQKE